MTPQQLTPDHERLAKYIAKVAHAGQMRKGDPPIPFIRHPEAVALTVREHGRRARIVAWLHDVIEDTDVTEHTLARLFPPPVVLDVLALTRTPNETYQEYLDGIRTWGSDDALIVKLADVAHNLADTAWKEAPRDRYLKTIEVIQNELVQRGVELPPWIR